MTKLADPFHLTYRSAVIIKPKQPFFDWLKSIDPSDDVLPAEEKDHEVYLIPDFEEKADMEKWFKKHFDEFFIEKLNGWYTDDAMWPQKRTFKMFEEWFEYSLITMVWDTLDGFIEKS